MHLNVSGHKKIKLDILLSTKQDFKKFLKSALVTNHYKSNSSDKLLKVLKM